jgi:hypothetical protein
MLASLSARKPDTAATIPCRSGHETSRRAMWSRSSNAGKSYSRVGTTPGGGYDGRMAEADQPLEQQLEEIGVQLDWVRDYL